jgi:uncharacterized membrane protein SpoIIM required for sporulation
MKLAIRTICFHLFCIIIFTFIYKYISIELKDTGNSFIDYLYLSVAIQSGTGFSQTIPKNNIGRIVIIIQELVLICTHIFTLHFFIL